MKIETFHAELAKLTAKLSPMLALTGELYGSPKHSNNNYDRRVGVDELAQITATLFEESWTAGAPWWPHVDPTFFLARHEGTKLHFTGEDGTSYEREPALSVAISLGECGHFVMHFDRWWRDSPQLVAWTFISSFAGTLTDYSVGHAVCVNRQQMPVENIPKAAAGNPSIFEGTTDLILTTLEEKIEQLISSPRTKRIHLNHIHAVAMEQFRRQENWNLLPWISVNEYSKVMGVMDSSPLAWDQVGPFDTLKINTRDSENAPKLTTTIILLNRKDVVQGFVQYEGQEAQVMTEAVDANRFWSTFSKLIYDARDLLTTEL